MLDSEAPRRHARSAVTAYRRGFDGRRPSHETFGIAWIKPDLIYCSISGFEQDRPYRDRPGHDLNYLAMGGVLGIEAPTAGHLTPPPVLVSDLAAGQFAAIPLQAALVGRMRADVGQHIDLFGHIPS